MSITALVIDDEPIARLAIVRLLRDDPEVELVGECGDGVSAVERIRESSPDLVFLDIQMPGITGLDVVATIGASRMPATVFVTAYEQFAVRAFDANAVDYLVKPFGRERFADALRRVKLRLAAAQGSDGEAAARIMQALDMLRRREDYLVRIPVREGERVAFVDVEDIIWIRSNRNNVQIHVPGRVHELRETMTTLQARLDPQRFARVHRSAIVNIQRIKTIDPWFNGHHVVTMDNGQQLRMSRYQHETFMRLVTTQRAGAQAPKIPP
ncbi:MULTISPECIES: LytR/AlgR family response regulator transcription factor [Pseudoxanthomonas]|jgi:two-component system LytT family response regulator|uniref:Response regulator transcription factor n=1 Tax=Pseudoxanthomonas winnipegensis TaxID=2480810 RepID=A0A4Q8L6U8_9GAMM|nr:MULTISPECIES: LytTR family DNA-binding domain-containing protein [Pseudoxanthomonas]PZP63065.1 MAG: DNA-binding response regulator [Pseudoxanthomonas spadix]TAA23685.1 response regulator transcription factor [Pseudoxanthomonas winnipegensis]TMN25903.1 response regulator transcription factor [Pseudoxanthomonas sp. X-1]UAY76498.1 LytTR family DNA-binding domain-containing protein [Pseudoxanthomonas sp. X-1]